MVKQEDLNLPGEITHFRLSGDKTVVLVIGGTPQKPEHRVYSLSGGQLFRHLSSNDGISFHYSGNLKKIKVESWSSMTERKRGGRGYYSNFGEAVMVMLMGVRYQNASKNDLMSRLAELRAGIEKKRQYPVEQIAEVIHKRHGEELGVSVEEITRTLKRAYSNEKLPPLPEPPSKKFTVRFGKREFTFSDPRHRLQLWKRKK